MNFYGHAYNMHARVLFNTSWLRKGNDYVEIPIEQMFIFCCTFKIVCGIVIEY